MLLQFSALLSEPKVLAATRKAGLIGDAHRAFEPRLAAIGLGDDQLASQTLPQLRASLERINDAIAHPEGFGFIRFTAEGQALNTMNASEAHIGPLPLLLERKKIIVERISALEADANVEGLRSVAERAGADVREDLEARVEAIIAEVGRWREQSVALDRAQCEAQLAQQLEISHIEVFERRSRVWQSFLERQSVATMLGALLLIAMFTYIVIASSRGVAVPELINNAFLVILGYFFGQAGKQASDSARGAGA